MANKNQSKLHKQLLALVECAVMVALAVCTVGLWCGWRKRKAEEKEADA